MLPTWLPYRRLSWIFRRLDEAAALGGAKGTEVDNLLMTRGL
jgi:hypothetical protein